MPTVAASVTTMIGFAALLASNLEVARSFSLFGIIGVFLAMVIVLVFTPAILVLTLPEARPTITFQGLFVRGAHWMVARHRWVASFSLLALFAFAAFGLKRLSSDVRMESFFPEKSRFHDQSCWFESKMGSIHGSDLLVIFPGSVDPSRQFDLVEDLEKRVEGIDPDYNVFAPSIYRRHLEGHEPGELWDIVKKSGWVVEESEEVHWRLAVRHPAEPDPSESLFRARITDLIDEVLGEQSLKGEGQTEIHLTGGFQLFTTTQDGLVGQLLRSFLLAFVFITPVIMLFLRNARLGLIAIIGNLFPLVVFFGLMGWIGGRIDIATMMIAAVAFGIAVDDTVHFLTWLGRGLKREDTLDKAVGHAFDNCAGAILQTTLVISLGMMAFLLCEFQPSVRFAVFSAIVLVIAMIGDLILLPSLILGAFQKFFRPSQSRLKPGIGKQIWVEGRFSTACAASRKIRSLDL